MPNKNNSAKQSQTHFQTEFQTDFPAKQPVKPAKQKTADHQAVTKLPPIRAEKQAEAIKPEPQTEQAPSRQITQIDLAPIPHAQTLHISQQPEHFKLAEIPIHQVSPLVASDLDRVRAASDPAINAQIDEKIRERLTMYAGQSHTLISKRIKELEQEWDIERFMAVKASSLSFVGLVLGFVRARRWLLLPLLALPLFFQHSTTGTCLLTPLARRMGFRTRHEIDAEKYALKVLRGDFGDLDVDVASSVSMAINAITR